MEDKKEISFTGTIQFEPINYTKKHELQSSWKRIVLILIPGEICDLYSYFIFKRYNLTLNKPLRQAHISLVNDSINDLRNNEEKTLEEVDELWEKIKQKYDGKDIEITLNVDARTNGKTWWLNLSEECENKLHDIRNELGLGKPFHRLHLSIGYANEKNIEHSEYIHGLIKKGFSY